MITAVLAAETMPLGMIGSAQKLQVLDRIVLSIAVAVVDVLISSELSSKMPLHDSSMLKRINAARHCVLTVANQNITLDACSSALPPMMLAELPGRLVGAVSMLRSHLARLAAKLPHAALYRVAPSLKLGRAELTDRFFVGVRHMPILPEIAFWFGSSKSGQGKDDTIAAIAAQP